MQRCWSGSKCPCWEFKAVSTTKRTFYTPPPSLFDLGDVPIAVPAPGVGARAAEQSSSGTPSVSAEALQSDSAWRRRQQGGRDEGERRVHVGASMHLPPHGASRSRAHSLVALSPEWPLARRLTPGTRREGEPMSGRMYQ